MTSFDEREKSFENKYAHDEKMNFRIEARASKLFGRWAAGKMGLSGAAAEDYASQVVQANLEIAGFDDVYKKVGDDFQGKKIDISRHMMEAEMTKLFEEARRQVLSEGDKQA